MDLLVSDSNKETQDREHLRRTEIHQTDKVVVVEHVISKNVIEYEQVEVENLRETLEAVHVNEEDDLLALVGQTEPIENTNNRPIDFVSVKNATR